MHKNWIRYGICGAAAGLINGFFGAGGGMVLVPMLIRFGKLEDKKAFSSAISIILPLCLVSIAVYWIQGGLALASSLPYLIELDNAGFATKYIDIPYFPKQTEWYKGGWWGYDEIGWFSVQPAWYRHWWLRHAWHWIKNIDGNGYCQMPGRRGAAVHYGPNLGEYRHETYIAHVWGDVEAIRQIWVDDRAEAEV